MAKLTNNYISSLGRALKEGFVYYCLLTSCITIMFVWYILNSQILGVMDFMGWTFYITSCISHAACLSLIVYVLYAAIAITSLSKVAKVIMSLLSAFGIILCYINQQVYQIYKFHINGFVINMITGPSASQIFTFDIRLYFLYGLYALIVLVACIGAWRLVGVIIRKKIVKVKSTCIVLAVILASTLFAHIYHIFASFYQKQSVIVSERLLPYFFPTTSYGFLTETLGITPPENVNMDFGTSGEMRYPLNPIVTENTDSTRLNILYILIDSWNPRSLTKECMPNIYAYSQDNLDFRNHLSGSNGTRSGVFSLFFSLPSYYWNMAEGNHITPVILDVAREQGYIFRNYPGASQLDPPFGRVLFAKEKDVRIETSGKTVYDRDEQITKDFIADIKSVRKRKEPFFSFLFYDLPHSFEPSPQHDKPFQPAWDYAKYDELNNDTDPAPFWNLYRNTCYQTDGLIGMVINALKETGLDKNTMVVITGDHSQEFNENKKNYWGHNGNFSKAQIMVPLIVHIPGKEHKVYNHRTTHYDIIPTTMRIALGVKNPESDYSMGHQLTDTQSRNWHVVGSELNYAFIVENDTILEKSAEGRLLVYDAYMNMVSDYHLSIEAFSKAVEKLNRFMK
jgi:membrane-anchored protein YejM (alkaline phosphatase superfamily)